MVVKTWETFFKFHQLAGLVLLALVATVLYANRNISYWKAVKEKQTANCDFFNGRWVYDKGSSYNVYKENECSFMELSFACERNGRKDFEYRKWRWQPHYCDIPRFDGNAFLEKIRGKKVMFVGDSLNRNQWVSMLCMIEPYLPPSANKTLTLATRFNSFYNEEYNTTIGFYWSPFLVESNCDDYLMHRNFQNHVVRIEAIEKHALQWNDADIIIFNSHVWWLNPKVTLLWGSFASPDAIFKKLNMNNRIYKMALNTWSDWLEMNLNRTKTKLFFMGSSPYITRSDTLRHCYNRRVPISEEDFVVSNQTMASVLVSALKRLEERGVNVEYLRVTRMSEYRRDAHPSVYRSFPMNEENKRDPLSFADCLHWCLPGVPDFWNRILYDYIMKL